MKRVQAAATDDGTSSFERFEELAKRLFAVPKKELDEKLATYRRRTHRAKRSTPTR